MLTQCVHPKCEHPKCVHPKCEHPKCEHPKCEHALAITSLLNHCGGKELVCKNIGPRL